MSCIIFFMFLLGVINFQECPVGMYKDVDGSDPSLCTPCSLEPLPQRAAFIYIRGNCFFGM